MRALVLVLLAALASRLGIDPALAHAGHHHRATLEWSLQGWVVLSLSIPILLYGLGVWRLRGRLGPGRVIAASQIAAFAGGMLILFLALVSPIDTIAAQLFSVHMIQHLLLLFAAPPLLVWSQPAVAFIWAFRSRGRRLLGGIFSKLRLERVLRSVMSPPLVWVLFSGLFIFWHFPKPYGWALRNEGIHTLEHLCFFVPALMFWTIVIEPSGRRRLSYGATLVHVATTAVLGSLPGAIIVLAQRPLYPEHAAGAAAWGLTALQDQQLAGVIMWVPAGLAYVIAISFIFLQWLGQAEREEIKRAARFSAGALVLLVLPVLVAGCGGEEPAGQSALLIAGDPQHGRWLIEKNGCGSCHTIPGIDGADALVGPPLNKMARRIYIAGYLRNTPDNLAAWIERPQVILPGNAMPNMGLTRNEAEDVAAYLYTLR